MFSATRSFLQAVQSSSTPLLLSAACLMTLTIESHAQERMTSGLGILVRCASVQDVYGNNSVFIESLALRGNSGHFQQLVLPADKDGLLATPNVITARQGANTKAEFQILEREITNAEGVKSSINSFDSLSTTRGFRTLLYSPATKEINIRVATVDLELVDYIWRDALVNQFRRMSKLRVTNLTISKQTDEKWSLRLGDHVLSRDCQVGPLQTQSTGAM